MNIHSARMPKQAKALLDGKNKVSTYEETGGKVTAQFVSHNLTLLPPITSGSTIHDNACGSGTVSRVILSSNRPANIKIYATDIDQPFLDQLQEDTTENSWPIEVSNQKGENLSFPDNFFDLSITNIGIFFFTSGGLDGSKEIYRTLKPGGTAVVSCWEKITWLMPIMATHTAMRAEKPFPTPSINWADGHQIQKVMLDAGFAKDKMRVEKGDAWAKTSDLRAWAEKSWAYLAGIGGWHESDEEKWDQAVDMLVEKLKEQDNTKDVDGETWLKAGQWVVVATK